MLSQQLHESWFTEPPSREMPHPPQRQIDPALAWAAVFGLIAGIVFGLFQSKHQVRESSGCRRRRREHAVTSE
jgi:hypothetical protein